MHIARLSAEQALGSLHTGPLGLGEAEAQRRRREFGPNRIEEAARRSRWLSAVGQVTHLFALVLWVAAALAFVAEYSDPGQGMATLGAAIVGVILVNGAFSFWQEYRAEAAIAALRRLLPQEVKALRAGALRTLDATQLVPGDVLLLEEGDGVPADCRVLESAGLRVDNGTLTGEALPLPRDAVPEDAASPMYARNLLLAGTSVAGGRARAVVYATGMMTEFGRIAGLAQAQPAAPSPLQREIARLSRLVTALAAALGVAFFLVGDLMGLPFWGNFIFAIGIIVANVPEGLLPTVTLSLAMATQRMARRNALVRHLPAVETLGATNVILSDKTGTLTLNRMTVTRVHADGAERDAADVAGLAQPLRRRLLAAARHCEDVKDALRGSERLRLGDPTEVALVDYAMRHGAQAPARRVSEIPFDARRRCMSVVVQEAEGTALYAKGALESLLARATGWASGRGDQALDEPARQAFLAAQDRLARAGLRVIALAWRPLAPEEAPAEEGLVLLGLAGIEDPPRPEVPEAVARCRAAGIRVVMVTGDHPSTARAIAQRIGLVGPAPNVLHGDEMTRLSDIQLQLALDRPDLIFARVAPEQKMRLVKAFQAKGEVVAVTGDGVNDAPALKAADIGIAMGVTGTNVAKEAADMILLDDNFASIVHAVEEGRAVYDNIRKFLTYILSSNVPELVPYLAFVLLRIPLPLTVVQILAVDLGTDMLPALALGAEPPAADVMRRPPRPRHERLLNARLLARAYLFLGGMEAVVALAAFFFVLDLGGWGYGDPLPASAPLYLQATTACLAGIVLAQVVNVFLCRDGNGLRGLRANPLLGWAVAVELGLIALIVYTPPGNALFGTAPLPAEAWLHMLPFAFAMALADAGRRALGRAQAGRRPADKIRT